MAQEPNDAPIRIGILSAARIAPTALVRPARQVPEVCAYGVAARVPARAGAFQIKQGLVKAYPSYEALLASDEIDAVYNPLPNGLHCEWTLRALEAGKHVLCEKPFAANAAQAEQMAETASRVDRHLMEAFHYRYHPLAARLREIIDSGELGKIEQVEASFCFPVLELKNIRFNYELGGGATMDAGCYAVHIMRMLAGSEPEVVTARATLRSPDVDRAMEAELNFPNGISGRMRCALLSSRLLSVRARVRGDRGELRVLNPLLPHLYHRLVIRTPGGRRTEKVYGETTYTHQLRAFANLVKHGTPVPTNPADSIANMRVIDAIYDRAGMPRRGADFGPH